MYAKRRRPKRGRMKKIVLFFGAVVLVLCAVLAVNTMRFTSESVSVTAVTDIRVEADSAAARLASFAEGDGVERHGLIKTFGQRRMVAVLGRSCGHHHRQAKDAEQR